MRGRKTLVILVVAMLFFTTIAVNSVFCDGESDSNNYEKLLWENDSAGNAGICGGGDHSGPGPPSME